MEMQRSQTALGLRTSEVYLCLWSITRKVRLRRPDKLYSRWSVTTFTACLKNVKWIRKRYWLGLRKNLMQTPSLVWFLLHIKVLEDGITERRYQGSRGNILKSGAQISLRNTTRGSGVRHGWKEKSAVRFKLLMGSIGSNGGTKKVHSKSDTEGFGQG